MRDADNDNVLSVVKDVLEKCAEHDGEVFGCSEIECGNYRTLELSCAKKVCREYLDILNSKNNTFKYEV